MASILAEPAVFPWACALLGLLVGSFLNVVIHRLPVMMKRDWRTQAVEVLHDWAVEPAAPEPAKGLSAALDRLGKTLATMPRYTLLSPRSACPGCGAPIGALQNIPVLSWLALRGRCAKCRRTIGARYPLVELAAAVLSGLIGWKFGFSWAAAGALVFAWALLAAAAIDIDTQFLPDDITLPLAWAGLLFNLFGVFVPLQSAVIGAIAGYLALWSVYWLFKLTTGKEGMGYGDFKLLAAIGAFLGWQMLPAVILLSSVVGAVVGIGLILFAGRQRQIPIPFGPYLAAAGLLALFFGPQINQSYLRLM